MEDNNILKGLAKHTYNCVINAMAKDNQAAMYHTFVALTQQAKTIVLQSGKFSNAYILGVSKDMPVNEAAKELAEKAVALVSCKVRNIDMIIAVAFLAEYISRQRKKNESKPTTTETANNMNTTTATENNTTALLERIDYLTRELQDYYNYAWKGGKDRRRNMILLRWDIRKMERQLQNA